MHQTWRREVSAVSRLDLPDMPNAALAISLEGGGSGWGQCPAVWFRDPCFGPQRPGN